MVVGPEDAGRRMSLDRFNRAIGREGYLYELNKGVVEVVDVPHPQHGAQIDELKLQLYSFRAKHPTVIHRLLGSNDSKILLQPDQSERHPDLSIYKRPPPDVEDVWSVWIPAIVIEVISKSSAQRDYFDKPAEYLAFGIGEYWIIDGFKQQMTAMTRWRGQWKSKLVKPSQTYTTPLLPKFSLVLKRVFAASR